MTYLDSQRIHSQLESFSRIASAAVVLAGCSALVGRLVDIDALKSMISGSATMKVNTTLAVALACLSLWLLQTKPPVQQRRFGAEHEREILKEITFAPILMEIALPNMDGLTRSILCSTHRSNGA